MRGDSLLPGLLLACVLAPSAVGAPAGGERPTEVRDEDYRFRLASPGADWNLLPASEARQINREALAAAACQDGHFGLVAAEQVGDMELADCLDLIASSMPVEDREVSPARSVKVAGTDAACVDVRGKVRGMAARYRVFAVPRRPFVYQISLGQIGPETPRTEARFREFIQAFSLLEGEVRPRSEVQRVMSRDGNGWRVREGVYEGAVSALSAAPPAGWRLVTGMELAQMDGDACVGLRRRAPEIFVVIRSVAVADAELEQRRRELREEFEAGTAPLAGTKGLSVPVDGTVMNVEFRAAEGPGSFVHGFGTLARGGRIYRFQAWCLGSLRGEIEKRLPEVLAGIRILQGKPLERLHAELAALPDPDGESTQGASYRRGVYRDFRLGLQWKRPAHFWKVLIGEAAVELGPEVVLAIHDPLWGVWGSFAVHERREGETPESAHAWLLDVYAKGLRESGEGEPRSEKAPPVVVEGRSFQRSRVAGTGAGAATSYEVFTASDGNRVLQWVFSGDAEAMKVSAPAILGAVEGLRFTPGILDSVKQGRTWRDDQMGFAVDLPSPDTRVTGLPVTPGNKSLRGLVWERRAGIGEGVMAMVVQPGHDDPKAYLDGLVRGLLPSLMSRAIESVTNDAALPLESSTSTLAGLPCIRVFREGAWAMDMYAVERDGFAYIYYVVCQKGPDPDGADAFKARFRLLE
jgi:hypothetical protein